MSRAGPSSKMAERMGSRRPMLPAWARTMAHRVRRSRALVSEGLYLDFEAIERVKDCYMDVEAGKEIGGRWEVGGVQRS